MFRSGFDGSNRMCLCGVMSAEVSGLPDRVRSEISRFRDLNVAWLSKMLRIRHPRMGGEMLRKRAFAIYASLEGAQLIAHGLGGDANAFDEIIEAYAASGLFALNGQEARSIEAEAANQRDERKPAGRKRAQG